MWNIVYNNMIGRITFFTWEVNKHFFHKSLGQKFLRDTVCKSTKKQSYKIVCPCWLQCDEDPVLILQEPRAKLISN